jgi:Methanogen output domain 1
MDSISRSSEGRINLKTLGVPLERDAFLRTLIRHLSGALQDVVGLSEASGFISIVGQRMGDEISDSYKAALGVTRLDRDMVRDVCLDLKRRIHGDFYVISEDDEKIVFGNRTCPFEEKVIGRPALCMMTSNVFGTIAAQNLGYGKVALEQTIAAGDPGCRVVLYLTQTPGADEADGREYLPGG